MKPIILACAGTSLTQEERSFFAHLDPFGFILFQRNCETPDQVRALTSSMRNCVGRTDAPIFIDQEGGRVARLKPPHWPALPAMRRIGELAEKDVEKGKRAARLHAQITAQMLLDVGINGNYAPVLDLFIDGASAAIGNRAISRDPLVVAAVGRISIDTYLSCGIYPVIKHMPGHGRVKIDPHIDLPFVDTPRAILEAEDFVPFKALADAPMAMNCHVVFRALNAELPVSLSAKAHREILRGAIGYQGLIFSDDLGMGALKASMKERAHAALAAGADIALHCSGKMDEMAAICAGLPEMPEATSQRWQKAQARLNKTPEKGDLNANLDAFNALICE